MQPPPDCPRCHCLDVRPLTAEGSDLIGFRCHDCEHTFYVGVLDNEPHVTASTKEAKLVIGGHPKVK